LGDKELNQPRPKPNIVDVIKSKQKIEETVAYTYMCSGFLSGIGWTGCVLKAVELAEMYDG